MRQRIRNLILLLSLLAFPVTLNYFSPYVSIDGAMNGIISGSLCVFTLQFLSGLLLGRAWCGWLCPVGGLSDVLIRTNAAPVNRRVTRIVRHCIFLVWAGILVAMFVLAGGIRGVDPFHMTESGISTDEPIRYVTYYMVVLLFVVVTLLVGRRGGCHSICWMAPFLAAGYQVGKALRLPQLRIVSTDRPCTRCGACDRNCPMSLPVQAFRTEGSVSTSDCILCGVCVDGCRASALAFRMACDRKRG